MAEISKKPYQLLVRWNDSGILQGATMQWREAAIDDKGNELFSRVTDIASVAIAKQEGFALTDILEQLHIDALSLIETHEATIAAKTTELKEVTDAKNLEISDHLGIVEVKEKEIALLNANINGLQSHAIELEKVAQKLTDQKQALIEIVKEKDEEIATLKESPKVSIPTGFDSSFKI